jgi:hypothetical protein
LSRHAFVIGDIAVTFGAMLAAAIPISLGGWGLREGALAFLFGIDGVSAHTAFTISLVFGASLAIASAPGALLFLFSKPIAQLPAS